MIYGLIENVLANYVTSMKLVNAGIDPQIVAELSVKPHVKVSKVNSSPEDAGANDFGTIIMSVIAFMMMIYMTTLLYGQMIGRSVIKEKQNKTVELLLSSARPIDIMFGKLFGIGAAGLVQYFVWIGMAFVLMNIFGPRFDIAVPEFLSTKNLTFLITFFILAYLLYSAAYAALGSAAEDEQHMGQLGFPLILFLMIPMLMITPIIMRPDSAVALGLSLFPFTSPTVMLVRVIVSNPAIWEISLSIGLLVLSIAIMIYFASKIFRIGILMTGKRFSIKEIIKWASYK